MAKVKVATVWLGGCSGCHMSFLDLDERLIDLSKLIELTASPITDIKEFPEVDVGIVEGSVINEENAEVLKKIRAKSKILVAIGDCACYGGIPALRNSFNKDAVLERAFMDTESTLIGDIPQSAEIPVLCAKVKPIQEFVKVDAYIPGCPPSADEIYFALTELLAGRIPVWSNGRLHYD
jgi:NAD-reducing hydrogenase small subunit